MWPDTEEDVTQKHEGAKIVGALTIFAFLLVVCGVPVYLAVFG